MLKKHFRGYKLCIVLDGTNRNLKNVISACAQSYFEFHKDKLQDELNRERA